MADIELIKPRELPEQANVQPTDALMVDNGTIVGKATPEKIVNAGAPVASEAEALAGVNNTKRMTPLRVRQVLDNVNNPAVLRAQAWAESSTPPDPLLPDSKSAKTWAGVAKEYADKAEQGVQMVQWSMISADGQTVLGDDITTGEPIRAYGGVAQISVNGFGPLTPEEYSVDSDGVITLTSPLAEGDVVSGFTQPRLSNSEAQAVVQGVLQQTGADVAAAQEAADRAEAFGPLAFNDGDAAAQNLTPQPNGVVAIEKGRGSIKRITSGGDFSDGIGQDWSVEDSFHITPDLFARGGVGGDTYAILKARDAAIKYNRPITLTRGDYYLDQPVVLTSDTGMVIETGARLLAGDSFSGDSAMVIIGEANSVADRAPVTGGGMIHARNIADYPVMCRLGRFGSISNLKLHGGNLGGVVVGDPDAAWASYQISTHNIEIDHGDSASSDDSVGILHGLVTDCHSSMIDCIGYSVGHKLLDTAASIDCSMFHPWVRPVHNGMRYGVDQMGSGCTFSQYYVDTPTSYGRTAPWADMACYKIGGWNNYFISARSFMNVDYPGADIGSDGLVDIFNFHGSSQSNVIIGARASGASTTKRWKSAISGVNLSTHEVYGWRDNGPDRYTDPSNRGDRVTGVVPRAYLSRQSFGFGIDVTDEARLFGGASIRGSAGTNRQLFFNTGSSPRGAIITSNEAETGGNSGSNLTLKIFDDSGNEIGNAIRAVRSDSSVRMELGPVVVSGAWQKPFRMSANRLWVDLTGKLRIKGSDPTSDTDGTVVGTQS